MFHKSPLSNHYLSVLIRKQPPEVFCQGGGVFLGISRGLREVACTCAGVFIFNRVAGLRPVTLLIGRLRRRCFPVGFMGFLGVPFLQSTSGRLFLLISLSYPFLTLLYFS